MPAPAREVTAALPDLGLEGALALGLVSRTPGAAAGGTVADTVADNVADAVADTVAPLVDLRPYRVDDSAGTADWFIASDLGEIATGGALRRDHVLGIGGASVTLSSLLLQRGVGPDGALEPLAGVVLDLGTGCGIQAMHASRHASAVVATDISVRALDYARFNAALNGIRSIEFRLGSLFEPVEGESFDRIISNPPFVITPRAPGVPAYEYRDGGMVGDALVEAVVRGAAKHLAPGGIAQLLGNWETTADAHGLDRIAKWTLDEGLEAWVVERESQDAALYAETWIRDGGTTQSDAGYDELYGAWLDDFDERGVTSVGFGYVTLRRPREQTEPPLRRFERLLGPLGTGSIAAHIAECLAARDEVASVSDADLLTHVFEVAADVTEERHYWPGDDDPTVMTLRQGGGFARSIGLDTALAAVVGASDGTLSLAAICGALAELLDADEAAIIGEVVPRVRELVLVGILAIA
jgi:methylase of polypeptide subunit release factors